MAGEEQQQEQEKGSAIQNQCVLMQSDGSIVLHTSELAMDLMAPGSLLIRTILSEVCGTDVHLRHARLDCVPYPIIPGHVSVGNVHAISPPAALDVDGSPINVGDVVTFLDVIDTCNSCTACLVDKQTTRCPNRRVIGITCHAKLSSIQGLLGGWSSFIYLPPATKIIKLPSTLSPEVFMSAGCGLPTALHAVDRAKIRLMDRVVVQGSGPVGLLTALLARASGALQVIVIGAPAHRLEVIRKFGISDTINIDDHRTVRERQDLVLGLTARRLADVVIEATGRPEAIAEGMDLCRDGGTYVVAGQYTDNGSVSINPHLLINRKHLTIKGSWGSDFSHFYRGVQFMSKHADLPWQLVISKIYDLKDAEDAIMAVERLEIFKALLRPHMSDL